MYIDLTEEALKQAINQAMRLTELSLYILAQKNGSLLVM